MSSLSSSISRQKEVFLAAQKITDKEEREHFLNEACGEDSALLERLRQMLQSDGEEDAFLEPLIDHDAASSTPLVGDKVGYFGDYLLLDEIARGATGVVFRARQMSLDRIVALKMLREGPMLSGEEGTQRLRAEAKAAAALDHPNIVPIYDVGVHAGQTYFSMKLVNGGTLQFRMAEYQQDARKAVALVAKIARAMQHAHSQGLLHRDLKPGNILIDANDEPHIADFGLARKIGLESSQSSTGQVIGTPYYMSPEQARGGSKELTPATDIYSLGTMLYELIEGHRPFQSDDLLDLIKQVAEKPAPEPQTPHRALAKIAMKCLEKSPTARFATAGELADALEGWLRGDLVNTGTSKSSRSAWRLPLAVAAVLLLVVGGKLLWDDQHGIKSREALSSAVQTFGGHRYQFVPGEFRWEDAKAKAEEIGGHLVTITSKEECEWVYATFGSQMDDSQRSSSIWLGGSAVAAGKPFQWVTGEPFTFTDWVVGDPDYTSTTGQPMPGPFGIVIKHRGRLFWFDDPAKRKNASAGFIVEWDK
ncbi:MAG: protein kinase [Verrucomicrobiaceae bacterium]|nr:protein kinase [Verrucomicrobiaceae bacterium]